MILRTVKKTVIFANAFSLGGFDEILPPGPYEVETDEELLDGLSFPAYRRVVTLIHLPVKSGRPSLSRTLSIDPAELDAALKRDAASPRQEPVSESSEEMPQPRQTETDGRAIERAEDEGMTVHSH